MSSFSLGELSEGLSKAFDFIVDSYHLLKRNIKHANAPFDQPYLEPAQWFLTEEEMIRSRNGSQRDGLDLYTTGNYVELYVASAEFFSDVADDIISLGQGDLVYLTGWGTSNVPFKPQESDTKLCDLAEGAVNRGADWRMLVWSNIMERAQNHEVRDLINALPPPEKYGPARFVYDDRLPFPTSSHHQKSVIIRKGRELLAYVGGVDLTSDRWDTVEHDQAELRERTGIKAQYNGWIDAHARVEGPATIDIAQNFLDRWNSEPKPSQDLMDNLLDFENPPYSALPNIDETPLDIIDYGPHAVQVCRTYSPDYRHYDFAPQGEQSIFHARIKAIHNAQNYIFIQDQYFILVPELLKAVIDIMPSIERLIVIMQRSVEAEYTGYAKYLFDMVSPIQEKFPAKFKLYTTKKARELYIHSKLVIVDDVYVSLGSANWNRRSMTSDTEIGINIVDTELIKSPDEIMVNKLARDFRIQKFMEATKLSYDELDAMTFLEACDALEAAAHDDGISLIEPYAAEYKAQFHLVSDGLRQIVDPDVVEKMTSK
ncbi:Phospholipase D, Pi-PLD-like-2 [Plasmopara halstedii]|uniref:phospholipase D n=1 Tax=Plasmopara halstedii TaxID=4781 RepID=A0A0P1ANJ3_PLAHL|nr:Phospholipase D, Pi-PLD-like-2 [Plasmopara halstedii]CEG42624.1 Phospholipase D, Pi-PLD-like-2 [Plasmopara halstedii]|eukprot:XP_024578993.1 Phospholipase D, Pi-PLD-like-2 [Plasmopara halstedii]